MLCWDSEWDDVRREVRWCDLDRHNKHDQPLDLIGCSAHRRRHDKHRSMSTWRQKREMEELKKRDKAAYDRLVAAREKVSLEYLLPLRIAAFLHVLFLIRRSVPWASLMITSANCACISPKIQFVRCSLWGFARDLSVS